MEKMLSDIVNQQKITEDILEIKNYKINCKEKTINDDIEALNVEDWRLNLIDNELKNQQYTINLEEKKQNNIKIKLNNKHQNQINKEFALDY